MTLEQFLAQISKPTAKLTAQEFCEISKHTFFHRTPLVAASVLTRSGDKKRLRLSHKKKNSWPKVNSNYM